MKSIVAYPGNMQHAQQIARALFERDWLQAFVTSYVYRPHGSLGALVERLPEKWARPIQASLSRRSIDEAPDALVRGYPAWEMLRSAAKKAGAGPIIVDALWDQMCRRFDALVARRHVGGAQAIHSFEYTALASFERARKEGVARLLHLPSLSSREFEAIQRREIAEWPELADPNAAYFARKYPERQARRDAEIALADLIVVNSSLTARSHIEYGADPEKIVVATLGAPPAIGEARPASRERGALSVLWAGHFTLGKGAHYLLDAWRRLGANSAARLDVYGALDIPERLLASAGESVTFHGAVRRSALYEAYERADVLVFPSLSDGFGMVVAEAMAHGLPVIATDMAGAAELVNPRNGLVVPAADPAALAGALRWCLDNRDALRDMRVEALETARRHQWSDYRRDLTATLAIRLRRLGYDSPPVEAPAQIGAAAPMAHGR